MSTPDDIQYLTPPEGHVTSPSSACGGDHSAQKWYVILLQVLLPFCIAGFGMVLAGIIFDIVQHWQLFLDINAIYTLVPALLGLKGNLEMTLASRFSTQVNLGKVNDRRQAFNAILGNIALTQTQAIVVGLLASVGAFTIKSVIDNDFDATKALVLIAGSISTASFASLILATIMMLVIIISKQLRINPDNIATPIAASLGDVVTLTILAYLCTFLYQIKSLIWVHVTIICVYMLLLPVFVHFSYRNEFVKDTLYNGWTPIILAMVISSLGGFIMGAAVKRYEDIAVFQPVVNGVGGNLVAIFSSRLSTALHRTDALGHISSWAPRRWFLYPYDTFFNKSNPESKTAIVLILLALPGHMLFFFVICKVKLSSNQLNAALVKISFVVFYLSMSTFQVIILLLICYWLVHFSWRRNYDPDNTCIPYLTAIGDLLGTAFLAFCFHVLYLTGEVGLKTLETKPPV